ncbi:MAG: stage sporulation protein [Acidobacteriota bacterium]|nr:stage sporulation protein [Acidobacteriota bacterium]
MLMRRNRSLRSSFFHTRSRTFILLSIVCACVAVLLASFSYWKAEDKSHAQAERVGTDDGVDVALERVAREALGSEDGTIIVMDPQTGRLRAVVNEQAAFNESYAPGSAIKPFTALAALRLHLIDDRTRQLCHTRYTYKDLSISCPHQKTDAAFNLAQALAYSCNYFFGKVGERLDTNTFDQTLGEFGFGAQTGVNAAKQVEAAGSLPQGVWRVSNALGESRQLMVTPIQLITAYAALLNGGHLFVPQQAGPANFQTRERARLTIAPEHRALLIEGMRGVVRYGTASSAGLSTLPFDVYGKTGTSAMMNDYHSQGWFIGFASEPGSAQSAPPESSRLVVLVFLKHSHGADAARVVRAVFEEYAKRSSSSSNAMEDEKRVSEGRAFAPAQASLSGAHVRIHLTNQNITRDVSLEEYVLGVVSAEGSIESELEALKALAVASRTYALHNLQRHKDEGYDFCDTTHCQRYLFTVADERNHARFKNLLKRAVNETAGETLIDEEGRVADAYFHAACGGMTANMETLWGVPAPAYLSGVTDEYCVGEAAHAWVNVIPAEKLARALQGDTRSNIGSRLKNIIITSRDQTGRVEFLTLEGETRRVVRGWNFKMIVGRALGWNILKSSRFDVTRTGSSFVFRGNGFGHGLGLCQEGAHALARRGVSYRQILSHYFPGTSIGSKR